MAATCGPGESSVAGLLHAQTSFLPAVHCFDTFGSARDPKYAQSIYPVAGAIDTELPPPPERKHIMLESKPDWVLVPEGPTEHHYETYPSESIADWHKNHGW